MPDSAIASCCFLEVGRESRPDVGPSRAPTSSSGMPASRSSTRSEIGRRPHGNLQRLALAASRDSARGLRSGPAGEWGARLGGAQGGTDSRGGLDVRVAGGDL
jgi:hypothetical protein